MDAPTAHEEPDHEPGGSDALHAGGTNPGGGGAPPGSSGERGRADGWEAAGSGAPAPAHGAANPDRSPAHAPSGVAPHGVGQLPLMGGGAPAHPSRLMAAEAAVAAAAAVTLRMRN